jgi:hypothetical protein
MKLVSYGIQKINSEWIKNIKPETVILLAENKGKSLHDIGLGDNFI